MTPSHDVVLVGGGGAGLRAAIAIAEANPRLNVAVVSKVYPMRSHTVSAEGGAAGAIAADDSLDEIYVGGSYDLGVAKLYASYQTAKEDDVLDASVAYFGATVPLGKGNLHADIAKVGDDENDDNDSTSFSIGYTQGLSKRTTLYVMLNRTTNDDNAARGVFATDAGEGSTSVGAGFRHVF